MVRITPGGSSPEYPPVDTPPPSTPAPASSAPSAESAADWPTAQGAPLAAARASLTLALDTLNQAATGLLTVFPSGATLSDPATELMLARLWPATTSPTADAADSNALPVELTMPSLVPNSPASPPAVPSTPGAAGTPGASSTAAAGPSASGPGALPTVTSGASPLSLSPAGSGITSTPTGSTLSTSTPASSGASTSTPSLSTSTPASSGASTSSPSSSASTPSASGSSASTPSASGSSAATPSASVSSASTPSASVSSASTPTASGSSVSTPTASGASASTPSGAATAAPGAAAAASAAAAAGAQVGADGAERAAAAARVVAASQPGGTSASARDVQLANLWALDQANGGASRAAGLSSWIAGLSTDQAAATNNFLKTNAHGASYSPQVSSAAFLANAHPAAADKPQFDGSPRGQAAAQLVASAQPGAAAVDPKVVQQANLWALDQQNAGASQASNLANFVSSLPPAQGAATQAFLDNHRGYDSQKIEAQAAAFAMNPALPSFDNSAPDKEDGSSALALAMYESDAEGAPEPSPDIMSQATLWATHQAAVAPANEQRFLQAIGDAKDRKMIDDFATGHRDKNVNDAGVVAEAEQLYYGAPSSDDGPGTHYRDDRYGKAGNAAFDQVDPKMPPKEMALTLTLSFLGLVPGGALAGAAAHLGDVGAISAGIAHTAEEVGTVPLALGHTFDLGTSGTDVGHHADEAAKTEPEQPLPTTEAGAAGNGSRQGQQPPKNP